MKKLYILLSFLFFFSIKADAQWVTIPDTNFVAFLQQNYPQCMNGNQMDTTCSAIVNATFLNCPNKNIANLTGLEYFVNILTLNCSFNSLSTLPDLPNNLLSLICNNNMLQNLPSIPNNLGYLEASQNQLSSLPSFLPQSINILKINNNSISSLPNIPLSLMELQCNENQLNSLPALPNSLKILKCNSNNLNNLPVLPDSLITLECYSNSISLILSLPNNLKYLHCADNQLSFLPTLPSTLLEIRCGHNLINFLPQLPNGLRLLDCFYNNISVLPSLPDSLEYLSCGNNLLNTLPSLPNKLRSLSCFENQLTTIPPLPNTFNSLSCYGNQLTTLPALPDTIFYLYIYDNPTLTCLPQLKNIKSIFTYNNIGIQCLPNYPNMYGTNPYINPPLSTYSLCDIFNNPNNCDVYWNISGKTYFDTNNNCINDAGEQALSNLKLQLFQNGNLIQQVYSGSEGLYSFDTDTGTFTYTVDTTDLPIHVTCPTSGFQTSILTPLDSMDYNMDFAMQCKPGFDVGVKSITRTSGQFFPGNTATVKIGAGDMASFYGLTCASGVSGSVIVDFTGPVTFISEAPGALVPSVVGNTFIYTIPDFGLVNFNSDFRIILQTDTTAQAGDQVCFTVNVSPTTGDNNVSNNSMQHCFSVVNSFDPNAKEVYPESGITINQDWLTYTIHFQNTGNAPAQNIYILDTLDQNLIPETFTLLSYSHEPLTQLFGNVVRFNFPNINLPDSTNDEPNSHGFVQYKIKLTPGLPIGTVISNIAYNFFDFNPPIATNIVSNTVVNNMQTGLPFAPVGAKWWYTLPNYMTFPQLPISYTLMESIGDTIIQGINASRLMFTYGPPDFQYCYGLEAEFYMYSDSNKVYLYNHHTEVFNLLYNFNANTGDSWYLKLSCDSTFSPGQSDSILITVDSVSFITVNGQQLKVLHNNTIGPIMEHIGMVWEPFPQVVYCTGFISEACASTLRCYEDSIIGFYQTPDSIACDSIYTVGINEITGLINFNIYPNPFTDNLNISFTLDANKEIKIELFNSLGQIVKTISNKKYLTGKIEINFSITDLTEGIYHLKFSTHDQMVVMRVVKM